MGLKTILIDSYNEVEWSLTATLSEPTFNGQWYFVSLIVIFTVKIYEIEFRQS